MVDFREMKGRFCTALRRDGRLTPVAILVGLEIAAWWSEQRARMPIYGLSDKRLAEILGRSERAVRQSKQQIAAFGYYRFKRTGRADLAWPIPTAGADPRSEKFADQTGTDRPARSANPADRKKQVKQENLFRAIKQPEEVDNGRRKERSSAAGHEWLDRAIEGLDADCEGPALGEGAPRAISQGGHR
jgi:hypothetical protein